MCLLVWRAPSSSRRTLLPDCGGAIERIAVALTPRALAPDDPLHDPIGRFIRTLSPSCTLVALTERREREHVESWLTGLMPACKLEVTAVVPDGAFGRMPAAEWIQDRFLCGFEGNEPRYVDAHDGGSSPTACLGMAEGTHVASSPVLVEGGNCLVGEDFWLVGCDSVRATAERRRTVDLETAAAEIGMLHDAPLHIVGYATDAASRRRTGHDDGAPALANLRQPWFHLDLMVSVTGLRRSGRPHLLVADSRASGAPTSREAEAQGVRLDAMVERLELAGFCVSRNPVAFAPGPTTASARPRAYNNVLVDNWPRQRVWLPQFANGEPTMTALDHANRDVWADLGFEVIPLHGWAAATGFQGAARCVSKVLARARVPLATAAFAC